MKQAIASEEKLLLYEAGSQKPFLFRITELVGIGSSCMVYTAIYTDEEGNTFPVRLKECYPDGLDISRDADNHLCIPPEQQKRFEAWTMRFTQGYQKQLAFRQLPESMNSISNIQGIYEGNHTKYIAMSCQNGQCLSQAVQLSLYDVLRILGAVAAQIDHLHAQGYLYLDLKPENIFLYPETPELVMLFDFDSAVRQDELQLHPERLSYTASWAAPEVLQGQYSKIGKGSDLYGIGALLLYLLFHRSPQLSDRRKRASWKWEMADSILAEESPEYKHMITEILHRTLCADISSRYTSCQELMDLIESFLQEFRKPKPYLKTHVPMGTNFFCGRDREMEEIHSILQEETSFLVLHGIGGIGKSEFAKRYAGRYADAYDAVIFMRYYDNFMESVILDSNFPIVNCQRSADESDAEYFARKMHILRKISTPRHLIILDNFDAEECDFLDEITALSCKFLITSRIDYTEVFLQYELDILDEYEDMQRIVTHYYKEEISEQDEQAIEDIIIALQGHTMALELIAKQMQTVPIAPVLMYEKMQNAGIRRSSSGDVKHLKDGRLRNRTAYIHIETLFTILGLDETEKQVLCNLALIGPNPMIKEYLNELCEWNPEEFPALERVITGGWVQTYELDEIPCVNLHPLIAEVLCNQLQPDCERCETLVMNAAMIAGAINELGDADERKRNINWLEHMAQHIKGSSMKLSFFFDKMIYPVYMSDENYKKALWCAQKEISLIQELVPDEHHMLLNPYLFCSAIASKLGDEAMLNKYRAKIEILQEEDVEHAAKMLCQTNMMHAVENAEYSAAIAEAEKLLFLAEQEKDDYDIGAAYAEFVWIEQSFGDAEAAAAYTEKGIPYLERFLTQYVPEDEKDKKLLADAYHKTADLYRHAGRYEEAVSCLQKEMRVVDEVYEPDSVHSIHPLQLLAVCYLKQERFDDCTAAFEKACVLSEQLYGAEHVETADVCRSYHEALFDIWQLTDQIDYLVYSAERLLQSIQGLRTVHGENSLELAESYMECSATYRMLKDYDLCMQYAKLGMEIYESHYDAEEQAMIQPVCILGDNYDAFGEIDRAKREYRRAVNICRANGMEELAEQLMALAE